MKLRNTIATGLGLAVCLCLAIAATTAQQTEERKAFTVHRVTGNGLPATAQRAADEAQAVQGLQGVALDGIPRFMAQPGPQRVVVSDASNPLRGEVPGDCGDTTLTQNNDPDLVLIGAGTVACQQGGPTTENSWARCFPGSDFPADMVLQCIDTGIEQNVSAGDNFFDVDLQAEFTEELAHRGKGKLWQSNDFCEAVVDT